MAAKKNVLAFVEGLFGGPVPANCVPIVELSKEDASWLLELNTKNRRVSENAVKKYVAQMNSGRWVLGNDALVITNCGAVGNGQHRLKAFLRSKLSKLKVILRYDCSYSKEFQYMDRGKIRTVADATNMDPHLLKCTNIMYTATKISARFSVSQEAQVYTANKLYEAFVKTELGNKNKRMIQAAILSPFLAYTSLAKTTSQREKLNALWEVLTATQLPNGDPPETAFSKQMIMLNRLMKGPDAQSINVRHEMFWRACHVFDSRYADKLLLDETAREKITQELMPLMAPKLIY